MDSSDFSILHQRYHSNKEEKNSASSNPRHGKGESFMIQESTLTMNILRLSRLSQTLSKHYCDGDLIVHQ